MSDPISWLLIEKGWRVYATDGSELGKVADINGDGEADIFDGLAVDAGFLDKPRYVPGETVAAIEQDHVTLRLSREKFEQLDAYETPPESIEIEPETACARNDSSSRSVARSADEPGAARERPQKGDCAARVELAPRSL